jgi:hypothetical protein
MTTTENTKKNTMDHHHHTNKATAKRAEGKQERTLKEEDDKRLMDKEIANAKEEDEEAEIREEGETPSTMLQHIGPDPSIQEQSMEGKSTATINCQPYRARAQHTHGNTQRHHWKTASKWMQK